MKRDGKARLEFANHGMDVVQSDYQGFQNEEYKSLAIEVMSKIKRLEVKGQKKKKHVPEVD